MIRETQFSISFSIACNKKGCNLVCKSLSSRNVRKTYKSLFACKRFPNAQEKNLSNEGEKLDKSLNSVLFQVEIEIFEQRLRQCFNQRQSTVECDQAEPWCMDGRPWSLPLDPRHQLVVVSHSQSCGQCGGLNSINPIIFVVPHRTKPSNSIFWYHTYTEYAPRMDQSF